MLLSPHPDPGTQALIWELIRSSGILAYVMLSASTLLGMAITVRSLDRFTKRAYVYEGHQVISLVALALTGVHMVTLLFDGYVSFSIAAILVPFDAGWRPVAVALGIASFYMCALVTGTSYVRRFIGQRTWRMIHYSSFLAWAFAALHGITAGSDAGETWVRLMYVSTIVAVLGMLTFRITRSPRRPPAAAYPAGGVNIRLNGLD